MTRLGGVARVVFVVVGMFSGVSEYERGRVLKGFSGTCATG